MPRWQPALCRCTTDDGRVERLAKVVGGALRETPACGVRHHLLEQIRGGPQTGDRLLAALCSSSTIRATTSSGSLSPSGWALSPYFRHDEIVDRVGVDLRYDTRFSCSCPRGGYFSELRGDPVCQAVAAAVQGVRGG